MRAMRETVEFRRSGRRPGRAASPAIVIWGLLGVIAVGTLLLMLPIASESGTRTDLLTALFTATSAACTTGLAVVDTQEHWSLFGEVAIVLLMQVGGLGFLVSSTVLLLVIGRRLSLRDRLLVRETLGEGTLGSVVGLVRRTILFALIVESCGTVLLTGYFLLHEPPAVALWYGIFHTVSAFTNTGFDLMGGFRSLTGHRDQPFLLLVLTMLIIVGGISYTVVADVRTKRRFAVLALDTKLVLVATGALLVVGTGGFLVLEWGNDRTVGVLSLPQMLFQSFFYSAASRTGGFASLNVGDFREQTLFFLMGLMLIGGAAGSTAGGIKVNSLAVLVAAIVSASKGRERVVAFGREIPGVVVMRALAVAALAVVLVMNVALVLTISEQAPFLPLAFEATSAFGTTGFSTGITPDLTTVGKLTLVVAMFVGRLGPLALAVALVRREQATRVRFPTDSVRIG
jgi:trk system potassium uptake protein TrkH